MNSRNQLIVVGGSGIGRAMVDQLAWRGSQVFIAGRSAAQVIIRRR